jgi:hypothetical protein
MDEESRSKENTHPSMSPSTSASSLGGSYLAHMPISNGSAPVSTAADDKSIAVACETLMNVMASVSGRSLDEYLLMDEEEYEKSVLETLHLAAERIRGANNNNPAAKATPPIDAKGEYQQSVEEDEDEDGAIVGNDSDRKN